MSVLGKLSSALGRKDEVPNQELAASIVSDENAAAIAELIDHLNDKNKKLQQDCIKVLYEIGEQKPELIASYFDTFLGLLTSKNNRMQWGSMIALNYIAPLKPKETYECVPTILQAADKGSVITRDHAVNILITLATVPEYTENALSLLAEQLLTSPENQLPMYAERILPVVNLQNSERFISILQERLRGLEKESRKKRVEKVIKKIPTD